ncbi:MAG TPA: hypothetical protein VJP88_08720 [Caulobacteraceae bacterium]|nr:hypothetical protein [Caulobacteraceae bacterium]
MALRTLLEIADAVDRVYTKLARLTDQPGGAMDDLADIEQALRRLAQEPAMQAPVTSLSEMRANDEVWVRGIVDEIHKDLIEIRFGVISPRILVDPKSVIGYMPRDLKAGDVVRRRADVSGPDTYMTVIAVHSGRAWCEHQNQSTEVFLTGNLALVPNG